MIDCHVHLGKIRYGKLPLTVDLLLSWMNFNGIDKVCLMATENPEELHYYVTSNQVLDFASKSDRFIPFCNIDPRIGANSHKKYKIIEEYVNKGARGFGEIIVRMKIDAPQLIEIYKICGEFNLPVLIHSANHFGEDDDKLNRLRGVLKECSKTNFLLHSIRWWNEVNTVENIFENYENIYGDISADSGYNFLNRLKNINIFLSKWNTRLIFGTDYLEPGQECKIIKMIKECCITDIERKNITKNNILKLLRRQTEDD